MLDDPARAQHEHVNRVMFELGQDVRGDDERPAVVLKRIKIEANNSDSTEKRPVHASKGLSSQRRIGTIKWLLTPFFNVHLINLFARASTSGAIVTPICLAVLRLITSSNLIGCSTGRSAGLVPLRILSTKYATRR